MSTIKYIHGDATNPQGNGTKIIVHCCNDMGGWGAGFVLAISRRWPEPESMFREWYAAGKAGGFQLGAVQFVPVKPDILVANLIGQRGIKRGSSGPPIRYEALEEGFGTVAEKAKELNASVHMPRIGCGLAGGDWSKVEPLIESQICSQDIRVTVYDFG